MSPLEILITVISLCSAGTGGIAIKCFLCQEQQQVIAQAKAEEVIDSLDVEHPSNHTIDDIVSQMVQAHKRTSKEGSDIETQVDISINVHSITHEEKQ